MGSLLSHSINIVCDNVIERLGCIFDIIFKNSGINLTLLIIALFANILGNYSIIGLYISDSSHMKLTHP